MKAHCHRPDLAEAFHVVSGVVPSRTPKEILRNVKLILDGGTATLVGTDQEIGIRREIAGVETDSSGEVLLPTSRVLSILRELSGESVDLEITEKSVWIRSGQSEFELASEDPDEFPEVATFQGDAYYTLSAAAFREGIRRTVFASDVESTRYALGGVLVEPAAEELTLAATDSRRLAVAKVACAAEGIEEPPSSGSIVPAKAMHLIDRSIGDDDETVQLVLGANELQVRCGSSTITSRLVEGRFPPYANVIPQDSGTKFQLVVAPFYAAVRQAQIVTTDDSRGVDFTFTKGGLTLSSVAADVGHSKVELPVSYDGDELSIMFDPRFVADFLRVLEQEANVTLRLTDGESAAVFEVDGSYTYVIMPLSRDH